MHIFIILKLAITLFISISTPLTINDLNTLLTTHFLRLKGMLLTSLKAAVGFLLHLQDVNTNTKNGKKKKNWRVSIKALLLSFWVGHLKTPHIKNQGKL